MAASNVKKQLFEEVSKPATGFPTLKMNCGCLASVMPGTQEAEDDVPNGLAGPPEAYVETVLLNLISGKSS